jgi:uncharacterized integral membrane protein
MRILVWLARAFVFFALFAFALNNQQMVTVNWFFGVQWQTRMVLVVLVAFVTGCAVGAAFMLPGRWRRWRAAAAAGVASAAGGNAAASTEGTPSGFVGQEPPRVGL